MHLARIILIVFALVQFAAAQFICNGEVSEAQDISVITGNVLVKAGTQCLLSARTRITGGIRVEDDATLIITSVATISESIRAGRGTTLEIGSGTTVNMQLVVRGGKKVTSQGLIKRAVDIIDTPFEMSGGRAERIKAGGNSMVKVFGPRTRVLQGIQMGGRGATGDCSVELNGSNVFGGIRIDGCAKPSGTGLRTVLSIRNQVTVRGEVFVQNGLGNVLIEYSDLKQAPLRVNNIGGDVNLGRNFYNSITVDRVGNMFMDNALVGSRITVRSVADDVRILRSRVEGDVMIDDTDNNVVVRQVVFNSNGLTVKRARLSVDVRFNSDFTFMRIQDNGFSGSPLPPITFSENERGDVVLFENNQAKITVEDNNIEKMITCRNNAEVVGSGNQIPMNVGCPPGIIV